MRKRLRTWDEWKEVIELSLEYREHVIGTVPDWAMEMLVTDDLKKSLQGISIRRGVRVLSNAMKVWETKYCKIRFRKIPPGRLWTEDDVYRLWVRDEH